jgi:spore germination protein
MKNRLFVLSCAFLAAIPSLKAAPKPGAWAYVLHTAPLSKDYLEAAILRHSVIAITGFKLTADGTLRTETTLLMKQVIDMTGRHRISLYPVISFSSPYAGHRLLNSRQARVRAAQSISIVAEERGFSGIHLDFEYLPPEDAPRLAELLSGVRASHVKGKISMAVFPPKGFPQKWSRFHDLEIISPYLDEIVLMCYDLHAGHTGPGPVTDPLWAQQNIKAVIKRVTPDRLWLGIPAYGYRWCGADRPVAVSAKQAVRLAQSYTVKRDSSRNLYFLYKRSGVTCSVYASDRETRKYLIRLAEKFGLAGTAIWRLGLEDETE